MTQVLQFRGRRNDWTAVEKFLAARHAPSTKLMYRSSVRKFEGWCSERGLSSLPAEPNTLAMFLAAEGEAGRAPSTITRHAAAIRAEHADRGYTDPATDPIIAALKQGIRRDRPKARKAKLALSKKDLGRILKALPGDMAGLRDRAILLIGFAGALRRSEIAGLKVRDIEGDVITLRRSKTDQEGDGQRVVVPALYSATLAAALVAWREAGGIADGYLFRRVRRGGHVTEEKLTPHAVGGIFKRRATAAGLDAEPLGAHSLRSGRITEEAARGASAWELMRISRHRSVRSLEAYVQL